MPDRVSVNSSSNQPGSPSIGCHNLQGTHRSPVPISRAACRLRPDPHEGEAAQLYIHIGWALGINTASKARQVSSRLNSSDGSREGRLRQSQVVNWLVISRHIIPVFLSLASLFFPIPRKQNSLHHLLQPSSNRYRCGCCCCCCRHHSSGHKTGKWQNSCQKKKRTGQTPLPRFHPSSPPLSNKADEVKPVSLLNRQ